MKSRRFTASRVLPQLWLLPLLALWAVEAHGQARTDPEGELQAKLRAVTGDNARVCGRLMSPGTWGRPTYRSEDLEEPVKCAVESSRRREPFWLVLKTLGFDSWTANGLVGTSDGIIKHVLYDYLYGKANFRTQVCGTPSVRVNGDGFVYIHCDAIEQQ